MKKFEEVKVTIDQETWEQVITAKENGTVINLKPFNIEDNRHREVVCIESRLRIKQGEVYTVGAVRAYSWFTEVFLMEVGKRYNSIILAEMPNYTAPQK